MKYQIVYINDACGNVKVLVDGLMDVLPAADTKLVDLSHQEISDDAEVYLIGFEIIRNTIPVKIMDVLENLEGKTILCFVTSALTIFEDREHIEKKLIPFLPDECDYRGLFSCPGRVPDSILVKMEKAVRNHSENIQAIKILEGYQKSMNHPNTEDSQNLRQFIIESGI